MSRALISYTLIMSNSIRLYMKTQTLKLTIEIVPSTSWYNNLRSILPREKWDEIRKYVYSGFNNKCQACSSNSKLHCHEVWFYNDVNHIQKLSGFVALCERCHHIKHIGLAGILASKGELDFEKLIKHFMKVNNCDRLTFIKHKNEAFKTWEERSKYEWQIDLGKLQK